MSARPEFADPMVRPRCADLPTAMPAPYQEDPVQVDSDLIGATSLDLNGNNAGVQVTIPYAIRCGTADLSPTRK